MKTDLFRPYSWSCEAGVLSIVAPVAESVVDFRKAMGLPLTWPENLGRGEPYHDGEWRQKG